MRYLGIFLAILLAVASCTNKKSAESGAESTKDTVSMEEKMPKLTVKWETDTIFSTPESVLYDEGTGLLYVSNVSGNPTEKDGNGTISTMNPDGTVENIEWVSGLSSPKGMGIHQGKLYVTDITELAVIDMSTASVEKVYPVEGSIFLNDVTIDSKGIVYFSDTRAGNIHKLENDKISLVLDSLQRVNGLLMDGDHLLIATEEGFHKYDVANDKLEMISTEASIGDGIVKLASGDYVVSRWKGEMFYVKTDGTTYKIHDSVDEMNTADIGLIAAENLVLVPTFYRNKIVAYELGI